ncbi:hypothetical protein Ahy_A07g034292 isoform D [Arachis hypogaea]|uniref:Uncharacterized protein n=1 Tax=Arachis hypogaea TaxID=3818 RepID=A0A445CBT9_ARAHY|nr:hypothetical protein Ahy_A07g034292 isoform D [Arachis hypogaea]
MERRRRPDPDPLGGEIRGTKLDSH